MKLLSVKLVKITMFGGLFLLSGRLAAQNKSTGEIRGTVLDASGARVPDVTIQVTNTLTGVPVTAVTDPTGTYDAPFLQPGTYSLTFRKSGFKQFVRDGVILHLEVLTIDAQLQVGAVSQTVNVAGASPLIQTESSDRKVALEFSEITELPVVGRSVLSYWSLAPGANYGDSRSADLAPGTANQHMSFNGQRDDELNAVTDGGVAVFPHSYLIDVNLVPLEAIQEVDLITDNFSSEYGNGVSVFSTLTRSGTNKWHGSAFEFDQNKAFGTRNFFSQSTPALIWNQFGGSVGGPIKRDKAFFFFSYEGARYRQPAPSIVTVPTAAERQGDFSAAGLPQIYDPSTTTTASGTTTRQPFLGNIITSAEDPVAGKIMAYWPLPNLPGLANNYYYVAGSTTTANKYLAKVDYQMSSKNRLSATFFGTYQTAYALQNFNTGVCWANCGMLVSDDPELALSDTWTVSTQMVNEFRFGFLRTREPWAVGTAGMGYPAKLGLKNPGSDTFPNIAVSGAVTTQLTAGANSGYGYNLEENAFVPSDTFTWIKGRHIVKFGGEFDRWQVNLDQPWFDEGHFSFSGIATRDPAIPSSTGIGLADFYLGSTSSYSLDIAPGLGNRSWIVQAFAQDDFKIRRNLTLNIGVRYQNQPGWSEVFNRYSDFDPTLTNTVTNTPGGIWFAGQAGRTAMEATKKALFVPRVGFAWTPREKLVVRGGFGIYFLPWSCDTYCNVSPSGFSIINSAISTNNITPVFSLVQGPPAYAQPSASNRTNAIANGQATGYWIYQPPMAYSEQGQLGLQRQVSEKLLVEAVYVYTKGTHLEFPRDIDQVPGDLLGPGDAQLNRPYTQYQGISTNLYDGESSYNALQLSAQKKQSHGVSFTVNYALSKTMDDCAWDHNYGVGCPWQIASKPQATWSLSQMDVAQRFTGSFVYKLPENVGKSLTSGRGVLNAVAGGWQVSGIFDAEGGVPFPVTMSGANLSGSLAGTWLPNRIGSGALSNPSIQQWFNPGVFVAPSPYTFGNTGRNVLRGPGFWDLDFGLAKSFRLKFLGEKAFLQVRGDAYDVFDHANFGQPASAIGALGVGVITRATTNRTVQLGARIEF